MIPRDRSMVLRGHAEQKSPNEFKEEINSQVEGMLQALGARVMQALHSGAEKANKFDKAYTDRIRQGYDLHKDPFAEVSRGTYIDDIINGERNPNAKLGERAAVLGVDAGMLAANIGSRYALPAGGAVLAAKGLADLTQGFYDSASEVPIL